MNRHRFVRFILLCEGPSDQALESHLRKLLTYCGAEEAVGTSIPFGRVRAAESGRGNLIARKIRTVLSADSALDLVFLHRDANSVGTANRTAELRRIMGAVDPGLEWIPVIPVRATEAWLLLDETALRRVAGNPRGEQSLPLPKPSQVEHVSDPKELLKTTLAKASGKQGRRLSRIKQSFGQHRRILLEQLPVGGDLEEVPAWCQLKQHVSAFVDQTSS